MTPRISPLAGTPAPPSLLVDVAMLVTAYYAEVPDSSVPTQRVSFGTSGHRGSAFDISFNEWHVLAITQAICGYRTLFEVPAGFKWFAGSLHDGTLGFAGEGSAGANFLRRDGMPWTTDKDGIAAALLSAEITARCGRDQGELYAGLAQEFGDPLADRIEAPATPQQKKQLAALAPRDIKSSELAGEKIAAIQVDAPGNGAPIGGVKVIAKSGWLAARPSGTEELYKIYAESFDGADHLRRILDEAQAIVDRAIKAPSPVPDD